MSVEPPSSGRPTGPPSGPLSGPSQPPYGPASPPPGAGGGSGGPGGPGGPGDEAAGANGGGGGNGGGRLWWRSPRALALTTAVVAAAALVLGLVLGLSGGGSGKGGEVFLQAAAKTGPDPFTDSTATDSSAPPISAAPTGSSAPANAVRGIDGGAPGLYGGTRDVSSCDVERQIKALGADPAKNRAFASVAGVRPSGVPAYLRALTPVQLRMDTRVTNHGYRDGSATAYQAVLQTGTAVLVDDRGVPRVRCACGNPLTPPVPQPGTLRRTGDSWPGFRASSVVVVAPAARAVDAFVLYDPEHREWFERHPGDTGRHDRKTAPPAHLPSPSVSGSGSTSPSSTSSPSSTPPSSSTSPSSSTAPGSPSEPSSPSSPAGPSSPPSGPPESGSSSPPEPQSSSSLSAPPAGTSAGTLVPGSFRTTGPPVM